MSANPVIKATTALQAVKQFAGFIGCGDVSSASSCLSDDFQALNGMQRLDQRAFEHYLEALTQPLVEQDLSWQFSKTPCIKEHSSGIVTDFSLLLFSGESADLSNMSVQIHWFLLLGFEQPNNYSIKSLCSQRS
ncbi:MAG: hypothetical protein AAFW84_07635 [Cyanobacteria bacterium J06635_15]